MKNWLIKTLSGLLPFNPDTEAWYKRLKLGGVVEAETVIVRSPKFHRKYFALLNIGFDNWHPGEIGSQYGVPQKNFERFRKDIAILCGYFDIVIRLDGTSRIEAKSISFASMEEEEFQDLYSKTIDVFLERIYDKNMTAEQLDNVVNQYLSFV